MSIESAYGLHIPTCDGCGEELAAEYDFYDAVNAKKIAGWYRIEEDWDWQDYCPTCYKEMYGAANDFAEVVEDALSHRHNTESLCTNLRISWNQFVNKWATMCIAIYET